MDNTAELETKSSQGNWEQIDLYRFFAHVLAAPTQARFELLHSRDFAASLADLWDELQCEGEFPAHTGFHSYEQYESAYIALFDVGVPEPPVPLVESGHYKSVPAQQVALENISFYEVLGLSVNPSRSFADHLLAQLEFLSAVRYTADHARDHEARANLTRLERDFIQRHLLNWLPAAETKLFRIDPPVFPTLIRLLVAFLRKRHRLL